MTSSAKKDAEIIHSIAKSALADADFFDDTAESLAVSDSKMTEIRDRLDQNKSLSIFLSNDELLAELLARIDACELSVTTIRNSVDQHTKQISIIWGVADIAGLAPSLTDDEAYEVLLTANRSHNPEQGINWDVLRAHIDEFEADNTPSA